jgi:hypothetical protein
MRRVGQVAGTLLLLVGLLVAAPLALARWSSDEAKATITDVFLQPVGADQARMLVDLEYTLPGKDERTTWCSLAGNQADARLRPIPDEVLPLEAARRRAHALLGDDPRWRQTCTVYYPPGHPEDAVMVSPGAGAAAHAYDVGLALVTCGMLLIMLARRSAARGAP